MVIGYQPNLSFPDLSLAFDLGFSAATPYWPRDNLKLHSRPIKNSDLLRQKTAVNNIRLAVKAFIIIIGLLLGTIINFEMHSSRYIVGL